MDDGAYKAIQNAWQQTIKARAFCPYTSDDAVGITKYQSPTWYSNHGATYFIEHARPLTLEDVHEQRQIGGFINRSFIIYMVAILEEHEVIYYNRSIDTSLNGGEYVQLAKWLRNRFAHGEWQYNSSIKKHRKTRKLLEKLFPDAVSDKTGFVISIDGVLEPLKEGILEYIKTVN